MERPQNMPQHWFSSTKKLKQNLSKISWNNSLQLHNLLKKVDFSYVSYDCTNEIFV